MTSSANLVHLDYEHIPDYLKQAKRWLVWKYEYEPGKKHRKVPRYVSGRHRGATDTEEDINQLATFDEALAVLKRHPRKYAGLGFALGPNGLGGYWQGIDFDALSQHPELEDLVDLMPGYVERSPSGDGIHAMGYGAPFAAMGSDGSGVEAYCQGRYFTVTGETIQAGPLVDLSATVQDLRRNRKSTNQVQPKAAANDSAWASNYVINEELARELRSALAYLEPDDRTEWVTVAHALHGGGQAGFEIWDEWSSRSFKYDAEDSQRVWSSIKGSHSGRGAIFRLAMSRGWANPRGQGPLFPTMEEAANDEQEASEFVFISAQNLLADLKPPVYLVHRYIEAGSLAMLFGEPGTGKSFAALDWACCIATGKSWNGFEVKQGPVFYIAGEGHNGIARRLRAWEHYHGHLLLDAPVYVSKVGAAMMDMTNVKAIQRAVKALAKKHGQPALIVIDTLHRNMGSGDENSAEDIAIVLHNIDRYIRNEFGSAVLLVHHSGLADKGRARGSSSILGAMDSAYALKNADGLKLLTCTKQKEDEPPADLYFEKQIIDLSLVAGIEHPMSSLVLVPVSASQVKVHPAKGSGLALEILESLLVSQPLAPPAQIQAEHPDVSAVVTLKAWQDQYLARRASEVIKPESARRGFSRELKELFQCGGVLRQGGFVWISS